MSGNENKMLVIGLVQIWQLSEEMNIINYYERHYL